MCFGDALGGLRRTAIEIHTAELSLCDTTPSFGCRLTLTHLLYFKLALHHTMPFIAQQILRRGGQWTMFTNLVTCA